MRAKPTVEEALALARAIYARPGGSNGCCLHLVLDDDNCQDHEVAFCVGAAFMAEHADCLHLACMLAAMTEPDREAVAAEAWRGGHPWPAEVPTPATVETLADAEARAELMRRIQAGCQVEIGVAVPTPLTAAGVAAMREIFEAALAALAETVGVQP